MQIRIFTIPIIGGEVLTEEMNAFLRQKKVLQMEQSLIDSSNGTYWSFCIRYIEDNASSKYSGKRSKIDYKHLLDEASFSRFSKMRELRKKISKEEAIPAYAVFTDAELAELAKLESLSLSLMKSVKGIGEKKVEKYGHHFISIKQEDETSKPSD